MCISSAEGAADRQNTQQISSAWIYTNMFQGVATNFLLGRKPKLHKIKNKIKISENKYNCIFK